jgi:hypothetical protein
MKTKVFFTLLVILIIFSDLVPAQCFIVASDKHKRIMLEHFGVSVPARQGNFTTLEECEAFLNNAANFDPQQRNEHWCDCDKTNANIQSNRVQSKIKIDDRETQLARNKLFVLKKTQEKKEADDKIFQAKKNNLLGKLRRNKSFDQLNTTSGLSEQGAYNIKNDESEKGRDNSESSFTQHKIKLRERELKTTQVSLPKFVEHQKTLFEFIDRETKIVQTKIMNVQKEKIQILEKKNQLQEKITLQTLNIEKLKTEKNDVQKENREEIDSLLLLANQILGESEELNKKADQELEEKNNLVDENEALLNKYQDAYNKSKEFPDQSEQLLKELQGGK